MAREGGDAVLVVPGQQTGPAYEPVIGPPSLVPVRVIVTGAEQEFAAGVVIEATDIVCMMQPHPTATPAVGQKLVMLGRTYTLLSVAALHSPDGTPLAFTLHGRASA